MATVIRLRTTVLPGGRVEVSDPALPAGTPVEVAVTVPEAVPEGAASEPRRPQTLLEMIASFPPGPRSAESWEEIERQFQEDRDSWDR